MSGSGIRPGPVRGYLPLVVGFAVIAAVIVVAPSRPPQHRAPAALAAGKGSQGQPASGAGTSVRACTDRTLQVPSNSYSPPCFTFRGANGGATSRGVSGRDILVSYRVTADGSLLGILQSLGKSKLPVDTIADIQRTLAGLTDYFNKNFQFYGRRIKLVPFTAQGSLIGELFGGGQDAATADAVHASTDIGAFADISAVTVPYADALTRRKVISLGAPYVSDQWFQDRRPYAWSIAASCTITAKASAEFALQTLLGRPARWADGPLKGKPRKIALINPDNPEYQRCAEAGLASLGKYRSQVEHLTYTLDFSQLPAQAANLVARLKNDGITSVNCACDPLLPVYLTDKAHEQDYTPEWLVSGTALTDADVAGQLYQPDEWAHAFGASALGSELPLNANLAYKAYRSVRNDQPAIASELLFFQMYQLAAGLQMAGPDLTPETFEQGLFNLPERTGEAGAWKLSPGHYTPEVDAGLIWWDNKRRSSFDGLLGSYVRVPKRYRLGQIPHQEPKVFGS